MTALQINKECSKCRFRKIFDCGDNFKILGCMHEPYHGKWVAEIDECPKNQQMNDDFEKEMRRLEPELYQV